MDPTTSKGLELAPEGARCATHDQTEATVVCARCGTYCCVECGVQYGSRYLCQACLQVERTSLTYEDASNGQRFLNVLIDVTFARMIVLLIKMLLVAAGVSWSDGPSVDVYLTLSVIAYYVVLEGATGQTLGKIVTNTKVVTSDGGRASWRRILGRTLLRFVPFEPLSFFIGDRGWHDAWSGTRVVRTTGRPI